MSILNILIYVLGGIVILIYSFFTIRKYLKWKKRAKELLTNGQDIETAKANAYNEIYKKTKKGKKAENQDKPFIE